MKAAQEELLSTLKENGYAATDVYIPKVELDKIKSFYLEHAHPFEGFHTSFHIESTEVKRKIHEYLKPIILPAIEKLLPNHKVVIANFAVKEVGDSSELPLHRDWSVVDESKYEGYNIWFPLESLNEQNGVIGFIKGSHKEAYPYRSPSKAESLHQISPELKSNLDFLFLKAGQIMFFNHATIHSSKANLQKRPRIAVTAVVTPIDSQSVHYYHNSSSSKMETYLVDKNFYLEYQLGQGIPSGLKRARNNNVFLQRIMSAFSWNK